MTAPPVLEPGSLFAGKYRLERQLGAGGMGAVWLAQNESIGRPVAIKLLHAQFASDQEILARFRQEATAAARIGHPGIVDVLDMGAADDGSPFIVMERLLGETLGARLGRQGRLGAEELVALMVEALDALAAAHDAGIVHRDLKPDNIFLAERPRACVKLLDFGISKFRHAEALTQTRTGMVMGTPLYMSPEQARGSRDIGPASDLYAVGAILYHGLSGRPPFAGESYNEVMAKVLMEAPAPLAGLQPALPAALCALVEGLLVKDPRVRPPDARLVRGHLLSVFAAPDELAATSMKAASPAGDALDATAPRQPRTMQSAVRRITGDSQLRSPETLDFDRPARPEGEPLDALAATASPRHPEPAAPAPIALSEEMVETARPAQPPIARAAERPGRLRAVAIAAIGALAAGAAAATLLSNSGDDPPPAPATEAGPTAAGPIPTPVPVPAAAPIPIPIPIPTPAAPAVVEQVVTELLASPESARWWVDGERLECDRPRCQYTAQRGRRVTFEARALGRSARREALVGESTRIELDVAPRATQPKPDPAAKPGVVAPPTVPSAAPAAPAEAVNPAAGTEEIGTDNPYAK